MNARNRTGQQREFRKNDERKQLEASRDDRDGQLEFETSPDGNPARLARSQSTTSPIQGYLRRRGRCFMFVRNRGGLPTD